MQHLPSEHLLAERFLGHRICTAVAVSGLVITSLVFFATVFGLVFTEGQCCSDDSVLSVAAKNIAFGVGYATSIPHSGYPGLVYFSRDITTGPALILPAAALIYLLGNEPWVPGLTVTLFCVAGFVVLFSLHLRLAGLLRASVYMTFLILMAYFLTTGSFEQWYALLGEMPATLLCLIVTTMTATPSRRIILATSLLFGVALMVKLLTLLSSVPFFLWLLWRVRNGRRELALLMAALALFMAPTVAFQLWQIVSLGVHQYIASVRTFVLFAIESATPGAGNMARHLDIITRNATFFQMKFGFSIWLLPLVAVATVPMFWRWHDTHLRRVSFMLLGASFIHLSWWIVFSPGWPRYTLIGLVTFAAALASLAYIHYPRVAAAAMLIIVAFVAFMNPLPTYPIRVAIQNGGHEADRLRSLRETAAILHTLPRPFITAWTGSAADLEYMLPTVSNFVRFDKIPPNERPTIIAFNKRWSADLRAFSAVERRCAEVLALKGPYVVARCPAD